jgi:heme oxygenase
MRLNIATRHDHPVADEPWLDLLRPDVHRADYLNVLVDTYGLVAPFESACMYTAGLGRIIDYRRLTRAGLIAQDLLALQLAPVQIAHIRQCPAITPFHSVPEAMGWLYLFERSTLLHTGVRKHLLARMPGIEPALGYLTTFEGRVGEHWMSFGRILDSIGTTQAIADEITDAALAAFDHVKQWRRQRSALRAG